MQSAQADDSAAVGQLTINHTDLKNLLQKITTTANQTSRTKTENAKLVYRHDQVEIKKEVQGTELDQAKLKRVVTKAISNGAVSYTHLTLPTTERV